MKRPQEFSEDEDADEVPCWQNKSESQEVPEDAPKSKKKGKMQPEYSDDEDMDPAELASMKKAKKAADQQAQVFISGLPEDTEVKDLVDLFAEVGPIKHSFVIKDKMGRPSSNAFVTFRSEGEAGIAIERYNKTKVKSQTIKVVKALSKGGKKEKVETPNNWSEFKEARSVVLRNVPECYKENTDQLRRWIDKVMPSSGLQLINSTPEGMSLTFKKTESVARAVAILNGAKVSKGTPLKCDVKAISLQSGSARAGRVMFRNLSWAVNEEVLRKECAKYGRITDATIPTKPDGQKRGFGFVQFESRDVADKAIAALNGKNIKGRKVAVDIAVDKRLYDNLKSLHAPEDAKRTTTVLPSSLTEDVCEDVEEVEEKARALKTAKKALKKKDDEEKEENEEDGEQEKKKERPKREAGFDLDNRTLFVRNISFEASQEEVLEAFSKHGKVLYVKLVMDKTTGKPKGTGFVKYADEKFAKKCLEEEELNKSKMEAVFKAPAKSSVALEGLGISLKGRKVHILPALKPEESLEMQQQEQQKDKKVKNRKKWMHLLHVGYIDGSHALGKDMHAQEKQAREDLHKERTFRGRNANFEINPFQITVRNLPKDLQGYSIDEEVKKYLMKQMKLSKQQAKTAVDKCVIVREPEKRQGETERKSLGFGFVRFREHDTAFKVLHHLNGNNQLPWSHIRRPITEFTIEDKRKLKQIEMAQQKAKEGLAKQKKRPRWGGEKDYVEEQPEKKIKLGRGAKQREKRRREQERAGLDGTQAPPLKKTKKLFQRFAAAPKPEKQEKPKGSVREVVPATHVPRKARKGKKGKGLEEDFEAKMMAKMRNSE